jgi:hypothetical protein
MNGSDDGSIADEWMLLRRIHPEQVVADRQTGELRVSSAAFRDPAMSVDVEELLKRAGLDWRFSLQGYPTYSLAAFSAAVARSLGQAVVSSPLPANQAHAEVRGHKTGAVSRALSKAASWVHRV